MKHPSPDRTLYLGMRPGDLDGKPYAAFWSPKMAPLPAHVREALAVGPVAAALLPPLADAPRLLEPGEQELEDGFGVGTDGSLCVAVRTELPGATPAMVDWWFGWHSAEPQRYKLWHPRAHVHAQWDGPDPPWRTDRERYVGRVSFVDEYLGSELSHLSIRFLAPAELGFDERALADPEQETVVCARGGLTGYPVEAAYLVHHVRRTPGGAQMRSRFWMGGSHAMVQLGQAGRVLGGIASRAARRMRPLSIDDGRDLLVHCSQEMSHLASFLPKIHAAMRGVP